MQEVLQHLENALIEYSDGDHRDILLEAKKEFFDLTGKLNEDDEDYNSRMESFNQWFVLHFVSCKMEGIIFDAYANAHKIDSSITTGLHHINYSLFEYTGKNIKREHVLKDILHDTKLALPKDHPELSILKNDLFIGRILNMEGKSRLMSGLCLLPLDAKGILKKESKKIRKKSDTKSESDFLLKIEYLKTKWTRYNHVDIKKIFTFS